ncbi:hypothetical protein BHC44_09655 [Snodgrassella alvi]|nr:hypothetical protein BHC44_09655 [Snodgrassella alvi]
MDKLKLVLKKWGEKIIMPRFVFWEFVILWISTITPIFSTALSMNTLDFLGWFILLVYFVIIPYTLLSILYLEIKDVEEKKKRVTDE